MPRCGPARLIAPTDVNEVLLALQLNYIKTGVKDKSDDEEDGEKFVDVVFYLKLQLQQD